MYTELDKKRYIEQWERVNRWYERVREIEKGLIEKDPKELLDTVYAFFMNCYHLKEWIKKSTSIDPENMFDENNGVECFKICADICNGLKHLKLDYKSRVVNKSENVGAKINQSVTVVLQPITLSLADALFNQKNTQQSKVPAYSYYSWNIVINNKNYNLYDLAKECMGEWEKFLKENKLIEQK